MKDDYEKWLNSKLAETSIKAYLDSLEKISNKFEIENIFDLNEKELNEKISKTYSKGLEQNLKSHLNKFLEYKNFEKISQTYYKKRHLEIEAIFCVRDHFKKEGYSVKIVDGEKLGYDVQIEKDELNYFLEVKGISKNKKIVSLTSKEYVSSNKEENYKICIVINPTSEKSRKLEIFSFDKNKKKWLNMSKNIELELYKEIISADYKMNKI